MSRFLPSKTFLDLLRKLLKKPFRGGGIEGGSFLLLRGESWGFLDDSFTQPKEYPSCINSCLRELEFETLEHTKESYHLKSDTGLIYTEVRLRKERGLFVIFFLWSSSFSRVRDPSQPQLLSSSKEKICSKIQPVLLFKRYREVHPIIFDGLNAYA